MKEKTGKPITFRPTAEVRRWLDKGKAAGFDRTEVINQALTGVVPDPDDLEHDEQSRPLIATIIEDMIRSRAKQLNGMLGKAA